MTGRAYGMLMPAQLVLARERLTSGGVFGDYSQTLVVTWEPARRRTILRREKPVSIDAPALCFGHIYRQFKDDMGGLFGGRQFYLVVTATRAGSPEEALDSPAYSLRLPHVSGGGSVCLGEALTGVLRGTLAPDEAFWCTDFVEGSLRRRRLVGRPLRTRLGGTPRHILGLLGQRVSRRG